MPLERPIGTHLVSIKPDKKTGLILNKARHIQTKLEYRSDLPE